MSEEITPGIKSFFSLFNVCAGIIVVIGLYIARKEDAELKTEEDP